MAACCFAALSHVGTAASQLLCLEPGVPAVLTLTPTTATNPVGTQHTVTATVLDDCGNPVPGVMVDFSVTPSVVFENPSPSSGTGTTDINGMATFTYGVSFPGTDTISAVVEGGVAAPIQMGGASTTLETGNPRGEATKIWTPPVSTAMCEADITGGGWFIDDFGVRANFGGNAMSDSTDALSGQEEFQQSFNVHSIKITAIVCDGLRTEASIFGEATINGSGDYVFEIDVTDAGSPGTNDTYGIKLSNGYYSGQHMLMGGNITIH
jgi:hypothetical protein